MGDKSAFPWLFDGPEGMDFSEGMTYREWQWTMFAAAALKGLYSASGRISSVAVAHEAIDTADAMMAAIAERESK